jgi:O-antigen/teichoic acid export membrane protein
MIGFFLVYANVGVYTAGVKFVLMLQPIVETVGIVLFPKNNISAGASREEYKKNLKINYDMILLLGIPMAVGLFLVSGRLIPLFAGEKYEEAITVSRIMSGIILLGPIGDMLGSKTLLVFKKDKWLLICSSIVAMFNVVLNLICIPLWGINGAAAASIMCYAIGVATRYFFTKKIVYIKLFTKNALKYCLFTIPFIVLYIIFKQTIDQNSFFMFGFVGMCVLLYCLELLLSKDYLVVMLLEKIGVGKKHD